MLDDQLDEIFQLNSSEEDAWKCGLCQQAYLMVRKYGYDSWSSDVRLLRRVPFSQSKIRNELESWCEKQSYEDEIEKECKDAAYQFQSILSAFIGRYTRKMQDEVEDEMEKLARRFDDTVREDVDDYCYSVGITVKSSNFRSCTSAAIGDSPNLR